jgi:hypothetical protein
MIKNTVVIRAAVIAGCVLAIFSTARDIPAQFKADALRLGQSTFVEQLKALRSANPQMTPSQVVTAANGLLDKTGINFAMLFDSATCERLKKVKMEQKDPNAPLKLGATLKSVDAEGAALSLPEPKFPASADCNCYIELPMLQMTDVDFITIISERNIRFHKPANFSTHEVFLLDVKDPKTTKRKWRIPFRGVPIGISFDENVLYLAFPDPALNDLSLMVFGEGVFQIGTRAEAEQGGIGKVIKIAGGPGDDSRVQFDRWQKSMIISYKNPCGLTP